MSSGRSSSTAFKRLLRKSSARLASSFEIGEGDLGLDHPELGEVAGRVRILGAECGPERIDPAECQAVGLDIELARDGEAGRLAEEVGREIDGPVLVAGEIGEVERRDAEHRAGALGVAGGDDRRVHPDKTMLMEVAVHGHRQAVAHPRDRPERVGPRPQMGHRPQVLHGVPLGRDRVSIRVLDPPDHFDAIGLDLEPLAFALRFDQRALDAHGAVRGQVQDLGLIIGQRCFGDDLDRLEARAIVHLEKREAGLGVAPGADPALDHDRRADVRLCRPRCP